MKKLTVLAVVFFGLILLFSGCEQPTSTTPAETVDLDGIMTMNGTPSEWNSDVIGTAEIYRDGYYSEISLDAWSAESGHPSFFTVSYVDEDSDEYAARPKFLMARKGYGNAAWLWRVYGDANGFAADDTVTVSLDLWIPDMTALADAGAWFELHIVGSAPGVGGTYTVDDLVRKYEASGANDGAATGGWVTVTKDVTIDENGVFDVKVTMGNLATDGRTFDAFFDNLKVELAN